MKLQVDSPAFVRGICIAMPPQASQPKKKAARQERPKVPQEPSRRSSRYGDNDNVHTASPLPFSLAAGTGQ